MPLARNPVRTISARWDRRGGGPEARAEKAKRQADAQAFRKGLANREASGKDGRAVQSDRPG